MAESITFTVFTPTYNRAHTLCRVYRSLCAQTFHYFEWLIVDDGSEDTTSDLIAAWQKEANFSIRYFFQENKGKHIAINRGVEMARGELFLVADSDDAFVPHALETFYANWQSIPDSERHNFSGVCALCQTPDGKIVGNLFPAYVFDSTPQEITYRYRVRGEKWGFTRTDVMREFPFPEEFKRTLVPENLVWRPIGRKYKTRFINEPLRIYYCDQPGYMRGGPRVKYPFGGRMENLYYLNEELPYWFKYAPLEFLRATVNYSRFSFHLGIKLYKQFEDLHYLAAKAILMMVSPLAYLVYVRDKRL